MSLDNVDKNDWWAEFGKQKKEKVSEEKKHKYPQNI